MRLLMRVENCGAGQSVVDDMTGALESRKKSLDFRVQRGACDGSGKESNRAMRGANRGKLLRDSPVRILPRRGLAFDPRLAQPL